MSAMNPTHLQQFSLSGKLAIVTGGARGLGLEMVRGLAAAGATVYLHGRDLTQMTDAIRALGTQAGDIRPLRFELGDEAAVARAIDAQIGRAHVCTPVTNAPLVCRLLLET